LQISKPSEIISSGVISISHSELLIYEKFPKEDVPTNGKELMQLI
jgi:hypothetical protein